MVKRISHQLSDLDLVNKKALCSLCGPCTYWVKKTNNGDSYYCNMGSKKAKAIWRKNNPKECRAKSKANADKNILRWKYGIDTADYDQMVLSQNGQCSICGIIPEKKLCVDHDHDTGKVRSLLCWSCNVGLGHFKENIDTLQNAIDYIKSFSEAAQSLDHNSPSPTNS